MAPSALQPWRMRRWPTRSAGLGRTPIIHPGYCRDSHTLPSWATHTCSDDRSGVQDWGPPTPGDASTRSGWHPGSPQPTSRWRPAPACSLPRCRGANAAGEGFRGPWETQRGGGARARRKRSRAVIPGRRALCGAAHRPGIPAPGPEIVARLRLRSFASLLVG